jgi:hypothetical protein
MHPKILCGKARLSVAISDIQLKKCNTRTISTTFPYGNAMTPDVRRYPPARPFSPQERERSSSRSSSRGASG